MNDQALVSEASKTKGVDWWAELTDIWGKPIPIDEGAMTLRFAVVEALGGAYQGEERLTGDERVKRWSLATRIKELVPGQQLNHRLKAEDITTIKDVCNKRWPQSFMIGQIYRMIDPGER